MRENNQSKTKEILNSSQNSVKNKADNRSQMRREETSIIDDLIGRDNAKEYDINLKTKGNLINDWFFNWFFHNKNKVIFKS